MGGIKLTPFFLFLILLLVLVIAMIFGYKTTQIVEGNTASSAAIWTSSPKYSGTIANMTNLHVVYSGTTTPAINILYNNDDGSIVIPATSTTYKMYTRAGLDVGVTSTGDTAGAAGAASTSASTSVAPAPASSASLLPWSEKYNDFDILYSPIGSKGAVVIIIHSGSNKIKSIFRTDGSVAKYVEPVDMNANIGLSSLTSNPSKYEVPGTAVDEIVINGDKRLMYKLTENIYYEKSLGICVKTPTGYDVSTDYKTGVSKQVVNNNALVITLMANENIVANIISKLDVGYVLTSSIMLNPATADAKIDDSMITVEVDIPDSLPPTTTPTTTTPDSALLTQLATLLSRQPNSSGTCDLTDYIRKTEVVPPVCPACPACPASSGCNLSINSNGEIVDCNGKKYTPSEMYAAAGSPGTFAGALSTTASSIGKVAETGLTETGNVLGKTVDAAGNTITKTADAAGNVVTTTVDTAGNIVNKTVDTAANLAGKTLDTAGGLAKDITSGVGDIASGIGKGIAGIGSGAADLLTGAGTGATNLVRDTGSGLMQLAENQQYYNQQGYPVQQQQGYPVQQQQGYPVQPQQGYEYGYQPTGYSNYQSCGAQSSNYMPITNDFSQFT